MAIKVLISGYENTGKTTLISKIKDALIINCDKKAFSCKVLHSNFTEYTGLNSFKEFVNGKIKAYKEKNKSLPKYLVIDTVTHLYMTMTAYNSQAYQGFTIHNMNNTETIGLNDYLELLCSKGISIIVVAHTKVDDKTNRHIIPAQGNFKDSGSFLSIVNEAIFIERGSDSHLVWLKSDKFPVRSLAEHKNDYVDFNKFDVNEYLEQISSIQQEADEYKL